MKKRLLALTLAVAAFPAIARAQDAAPAKGRTLLLVDDHDVLYRSGTRRVSMIPTRASDTPLIAPDKPWEMLIGYTSAYRNPTTGKYQLWYQAYVGGRGKDRKLKCVVCYAESDDGLKFTKPELDLFPFLGDKSNIVLDSNVGTGDRYDCSVIVDPQDADPAKRYKMAYYDWEMTNGHEDAGVHAAFSPDGIHWTKAPGTLLATGYGRYTQPPFADQGPYQTIPATDKKPQGERRNYPAPTMSDVIDVFFDPIHRDYVINDKAWIDGPDGSGAWKNVLAQTRSPDFIHWSPAKIILPFADDEPYAEFHGGATFFYNDRYFAQLERMDRRYDLQDDIELAVSDDGQDWQRPFRKTPFIARSQQGKFDSNSLWSCTPPVFLPDEMQFYFGGYSEKPTDGTKQDPLQRSGIGMVKLPLDRFAGIVPLEENDQLTLLKRPIHNIGQVTFRPIDLAGVKAITVNADASKGHVYVELLNENLRRLHGYTKDDATPLDGDSLRLAAGWKDHDLSQLPPGKYSLRVHLDNATLYAITFK